MTSVGSALRRTLVLVVLAAGIGALLSWRQRQATTPTPAAAPVWPPLPEPPGPAAPGPAAATGVATSEPETETEPEPVLAPDPSWVPANDDGTTPPSHPIKAKDASGIFHQPGGRFYDRTKPDRCYPTAAAAEADGYRRSKS